ncbi:hypothetical protein VTN02DRAFT_5583 [Thermoascus thermophilus]
MRHFYDRISALVRHALGDPFLGSLHRPSRGLTWSTEQHKNVPIPPGMHYDSLTYPLPASSAALPDAETSVMPGR